MHLISTKETQSSLIAFEFWFTGKKTIFIIAFFWCLNNNIYILKQRFIDFHTKTHVPYPKENYTILNNCSTSSREITCIVLQSAGQQNNIFSYVILVQSVVLNSSSTLLGSDPDRYT